MEIAAGSVVRSIAGRDSDRFFVAVSVEGEYALIANGELRPMEKPKRKKLKHLRRTNTVVDLQEITTNDQLKQILSGFAKPEDRQGR